jgi:peptide deformylase
MTILRILNYPDPRLKTRAQPVENITDPAIQKIIDDIIETLHNTANCAALAAAQLDIKNPPRITVLAKTSEFEEMCLVNPVILKGEGEVCDEEGCMSVYPEKIHARVKRYAKVTLHAFDRNGKEFTKECEGFLARCVQHELDHLEGIIFLDHLSHLKRSLIEKKIAKIINP